MKVPSYFLNSLSPNTPQIKVNHQLTQQGAFHRGHSKSKSWAEDWEVKKKKEKVKNKFIAQSGGVSVLTGEEASVEIFWSKTFDFSRTG